MAVAVREHLQTRHAHQPPRLCHKRLSTPLRRWRSKVSSRPRPCNRCGCAYGRRRPRRRPRHHHYFSRTMRWLHHHRRRRQRDPASSDGFHRPHRLRRPPRRLRRSCRRPRRLRLRRSRRRQILRPRWLMMTLQTKSSWLVGQPQPGPAQARRVPLPPGVQRRSWRRRSRPRRRLWSGRLRRQHRRKESMLLVRRKGFHHLHLYHDAHGLYPGSRRTHHHHLRRARCLHCGSRVPRRR